jgi:GAF domain-containing protein
VSDASNQLRVLSDIGRSLATFIDLDDLVHYATRCTRDLFAAEGCALLLLDRERSEFCFPVASQRDSRAISAAQLAEIRFPADRGVAGWVLANNEAAVVADTAKDPRFYDAVDRKTEMQTKALLCAPLRTRSGNIGVIEVVNPGEGRLGRNDLDFLDALASEIGVAYEKAALYNELEREVVDLRRFCGLAGLGLSVLGVLVAATAAFFHRARVLPWSELPTQRGVLLGAICILIGALLVAVGRGWIISMRTKERTLGDLDHAAERFRPRSP